MAAIFRSSFELPLLPIRVNKMQRDKFLLSSAGLLALAGCSGGVAVATRPRDLASMMRQLGIARLNYQGQSYFDDGRVEKHERDTTTPQDTCPLPTLSNGRSMAALCDGQVDPNTGLKQIGHTSTHYSPFTLGASLGPGYLNMVIATGPDIVFGVAQGVSVPKCATEIAGAAGMAWSMALYIRDNAWKYPPAVANAAYQVIAKYQGTRMGIAAAAEFIAAVFASLGVVELTALLLGIGLTAAMAWLVFACYDPAYADPPASS